MYTPRAFWLTLILPLLFAGYILLVNWRYQEFPHEAISVGSVFSALIIGFIVATAMTRYDAFTGNWYLFQQKLRSLQDLAPELAAQIQQVRTDYQEHRDTSSFQKLTQALLKRYPTNGYILQTLGALEGLITARLSNADALNPLLWFAVFVPLVVMSVFLVIDQRLNRTLTLLVLIIIWLPVLIVYYLYTHRERIVGERSAPAG